MYISHEMYEDYLMHYGRRGMKWGRNIFGKKSGSTSSTGTADSTTPAGTTSRRQMKKETLKEYRQDKGPRRFGVMNAANSAARTYYRKERTGDFSTYRKESQKLTRKEARLTDEQVKSGRYRVARARSIKRNVASTAIAVALGTATVGVGAAAAAPVLAAVGGVSAHYATGAHYYGRERRAYGGTRAKYQTQKQVRDRK